jgi:hypothetical protein
MKTDIRVQWKPALILIALWLMLTILIGTLVVITGSHQWSWLSWTATGAIIVFAVGTWLRRRN